MNAQTVIVCAAIICFFVKFRGAAQRTEEQPYFDALDLADAVRELEIIMEQLETADRLTNDLKACEPGLLHRFFRAEWLSSDGHNRSIDLCAKGGSDQATRGLAAAARAERERLNQEAIDQIRAISWTLETGCGSDQATQLRPLPCSAGEMENQPARRGINSGQNSNPDSGRGSE